MIARLIAALALLALAACGETYEPVPPSPAIWEVSDGSGTKGWLFGTIHSLPEGQEWRTPEISGAIEQADVLLVEIADLSDRTAMQAVFRRLSVTPGQPDLDERVSTSDRPALDYLLDRAGYDADDFGQIETWAAALTLSQALQSDQGGTGVDQQLLEEWQGRPVRELEGLEPQLAIFDALPQREQADFLVAVAHEAQSAGDGSALVRAWSTGDIGALEQEMGNGLLADPELREALLAGRNRDWIDQIEALYAEGQHPFVAVGAAHLLGPDGLVALIEQRGYTVTRLK